MSAWAHDYRPAAKWRLLHVLGPFLGARLDAAVIEFAKTGRGEISRIEDSIPTAYRLHIFGAEADLFIDFKARMFWVIAVRRRP